MSALKSFSTKQSILFVLILIIAWFVLGMVFIFISSSIFQRPVGDATTVTIGRLAITFCTVMMIWQWDWLKASGITLLGNWQTWLLALGGLLYFTSASLYSFYGRASFDFSILTRFPDSRVIALTQIIVAISEEILFRGLVLYTLIRVWGNTTQGTIGSVAFAAILFAIMHITQVFTNGLSISAALLLVMQTFLCAVWWGALVRLGGSIWPAVMLHFLANTAVIMQGLETPMIEPVLMAYKQLLWFSLALGLAGIGLLLRVKHEKAA